ncbi:MAG: hypothetical protein JWR69_3229 [Pedosphaera sp.]|nr:hypothetical protein [Pedosphaera sp.]
MKRSPILADHVRQFEVIGGIGDARLARLLDGKCEIRGGTEADRQKLQAWMDEYLTPAPGTGSSI